MARIAIVKFFTGMTMTGAQIAGQLKSRGHTPLIVMFKRQEFLPESAISDVEHERGDTPMKGFFVNKDGVSVFESSVWKRTTQTEFANLCRVLRDFRPDAIGISTLSASMSLAGRISDALRAEFDVPILWGGTGPTLEPDRAMAHADLLCVGEGEDVLDEIGERLDARRSLDGIAGTWCRLPDGTIQRNPKRPVSDLEAIAVPSWDPEHLALVDQDRVELPYRDTSPYRDPSYQIMTQRGCPFACSFCVESFYQKEFGKKGALRRMSVAKAIRELKYAKDVLGYQSVTFMDDVFTVNPAWLAEFCEVYPREVGLPFFCYTYPGVHSLELLVKLREAGCHAVTIGVQSGSQRLLSNVFDRHTQREKVVKSIREIVTSGIPAATFDMIPATRFDREEDMQDTLELLLQIPKEIDTTFYGEMTYFPNYPILAKFDEHGVRPDEGGLTRDDYAYWVKMFNLTRTELPVDEIRRIARDPRYRANHDLLNPLLKDDALLKPAYGLLTRLGMERVRARAEAASAAVA
jgi:anaerobic magnesium-protoporphyrin IX monomethyl ester cyclase